jgi:dynein heavy chain
MVPPFLPPPDGKFAKVVVPTVDTVRSTWLLRTFMEVERPVLFVGDSGTAKTVTIQTYITGLDPDKFQSLTMNFSSRTSSMDLQRNLESSTEKRTKDTYGPPLGKKLITFIDDFNMPRIDTYGTQQPLALLKTFIERKGLYDRGKELNWKKMLDLLQCGAMGPPGGARNNVDPRVISLFNMFEIQVGGAVSSYVSLSLCPSLCVHHCLSPSPCSPSLPLTPFACPPPVPRARVPGVYLRDNPQVPPRQAQR